MKHQVRKFTLPAVLAGLVLCAFPASAQQDAKVIDKQEVIQRAEQILKTVPDAQKVEVKVEVAPKDMPNKYMVKFMDFDLNGDGSLSRDEVGEKLFTIFDRDGNHVIDNNEMYKVGVLSFTPMARTTIDVIDFHNPGTPQKVSVSEDEFMERSQLSKFDKDDDGLSPLDFLGMPFNKVNVHDDGVIDLYEFKRAYAEAVKPLHEENFNYNN